MPTGITHAFVSLAVGRAAFRGPVPWRFWPLAAICSALPDVDVGLMDHGVRYGDVWGHRGMTHSLLFAIALGSVVTTWLFRDRAKFLTKPWWALFVFFSLITASHGFLDAFTNGGLGVAFFSPFDTTRYFMPWRQIEVSPIGLSHFFEYGGMDTVRSELLWVWLPVGAATAIIIIARTMLHRHKAKQQLS